jgi:Rps23 Pro-64 3,4-dihydroxylase Tpa1-like proline 4-hydroxylase
MLQLAPGLDLAGLAQVYRTHGRLQIVNFLADESAAALYRELADSRHWRLTVNRGEEIHHFDLEDIAGWPAERLGLLDRAVTMGGRYGFQFRYDVLRVGETPSPLLAALADLLSSPELVQFMRTLTGAGDIAFADAHASRYRSGHFLTTHDDEVEAMGRRAAYVLNLTPEWRPDWGGLLQFYDAMGNVSRAFTPGFNVLNIFRVPQPHSVSWVTPLAAAPRYAVTGWLRAAAPGA